MCIPAAKTPFTVQAPQPVNQGQVNDQLTRMSASPLGVASTILTSPTGTTQAAPTSNKVLIGS